MCVCEREKGGGNENELIVEEEDSREGKKTWDNRLWL